MSGLGGRFAVVTGGTGGIGAATALLLQRSGAHVVAIGRSVAKAEALAARAASSAGSGSLRTVVADLSAMRTVEDTVERLAAMHGPIDVLVHAVGVLLTRAEHTSEGIETDFAVSYLSRFAFLEAAARHGLLHPGTRMVNIAASSPRIPRFAQVEFRDLDEVESRVGMRGHGQAQLADDLLTALAPARYGITAIGYGPGSVRTDIRREIPAVVRAVMAPFFALATRRPDEVAAQLVGLLTDGSLPTDRATFAGRHGPFPAAPYLTDARRQQDLLAVSTALLRRATGHP